MKNREYIASQLDNIIEALNNIKNTVMKSEEEETVIKSTDIDVPIGKTFEFEGKEYVAKGVGETEYTRISNHSVESICDICAFDKIDDRPCDQLCCAWFERRDNTDAYFVEKK